MNSEKPTLEPTSDGKPSCKNTSKSYEDTSNLQNISSNISIPNHDYSHNSCVKPTTQSSTKSYEDLEMCLAVGQDYPSGGNFDWLPNSLFEEFVPNGIDATA